MSDPVKKRTLGSYLSNLEERRSETEHKKDGNGILDEQANMSKHDTHESKQNSIGSQVESSLTRDELKTMIGISNKDEQFTSIHSSNSQDDDSSALSEVESDAPTEPASPPRPKRGRLIRADKLESAQSSRQPSVPAAIHDKDSDSELSDLEDLNANKMSSSIIHGDSSPVRASEKKRHAQFDSGISKKSRISITLPKSPKAKRGVHRDAGGRTKLQIACDKGKYDLTKRLIDEEGYDVNDQDNAGNTPLHEAALNGHLEIVKLLVERGANVNMQSFDMFLDTPLIDASANGHIEVVKYLLDHGADPTMVNAKGLSAIESVEEDSDLDDDDRKLIHNMKDILKRATRNYVKIEHPRLLSRSISRHSEDLERQQLNHEDDFYWTDISSKVGRNKLLRASKEGKLPYVGAYLENGGRPDFKCFMESCIYGHDDIVSLFLAFGAHVNMNNKDGQTPLMISVGRGHLSVVKLLLEAGADPQKCDKRGRSVLHYAKHSSLGLSNPEEIEAIRSAILKQYGHIKDEVSGLDNNHSSSEISADQSEREEVENEFREGETKSMMEAKRRDSSESLFNEKIVPSNQNQGKLENELFLPEKDTSSKPVEKAEIKRNFSFTNTRSLSPLQKSSTPPPAPKETPEERSARLKGEEEYRLKRIQQKKRKEQEFLNKLAKDEKKRIEEKEQQRKEEEERKQLAKREELRRQEELRNRSEVEKRRRIRSKFPIGLRLVNFKEKDNYACYGPVYYFTEDGKRWVLELQISILLKDANFSKMNRMEKRPVETYTLPHVWNIFKFLFLYGGTPALLDLSKHQWSRAHAIENEEYAKFTSLELYWISLGDIEFKDSTRKNWVFQNLIELVSPLQVTQERADGTAPTSGKEKDPFKNNITPSLLPAKYIGRTKSQEWLQATKALW